MIILKIKFYYLPVLLILVFYFITEIYSYNIIVGQEETNIEEAAITSNKLIDSEYVYLIFDDDYYKVSKRGQNHFSIYKNLIFQSKNGTILDFQKSDKTTLYLEFGSSPIERKLIFENITFINFDYEKNFNSYLLGFYYLNSLNNFKIEFINCKFKNIKNLMVHTEAICTKLIQSSPQFVFNKCSFMLVKKKKKKKKL